MFITDQYGFERHIYLETFYFDFYDNKFQIIADGSLSTYTLGEYDTPAQVEKIIGRLKNAVNRGDKEFTFLTADELNSEHEKEACRKAS